MLSREFLVLSCRVPSDQLLHLGVYLYFLLVVVVLEDLQFLVKERDFLFLVGWLALLDEGFQVLVVLLEGTDYLGGYFGLLVILLFVELLDFGDTLF